VRRGIAVGLVGAALAGSLASASTRFVSSWKAPDAGPVSFQGRKVAALVIHPDEATRLEAEGELSRALTGRGVQGIPAYNLIAPNETRDKDRAKVMFDTAGIEGVVVMRAMGSKKEVSYAPVYWSTPNYGTFWGGYYGYGWGAVYETGYLRSETVVRVETLVYDLKSDKLLWAGVSESADPEGVRDLMKELVPAAAKEMKKKGLIAK
jgi:hypothetical protein